MVLAYELRDAGYRPMVLEARARPGGRNWSLRAGDTVEEMASAQSVTWDADDHLYFNPGPARIPHHHEGILSYCRLLGVPLEVMCNDNRAALMQDDRAFDGAPQLNRRVVNDVRGMIAELAAKAVDKSMLTEPLQTEDLERLKAMLRSFGALDKDMVYRGSSRSGWAVPPDATTDGIANLPLDLRQILASDFWRGPMQFGEFNTMAPTMLQPIGGMGRIGEAFGRSLQDTITYQAVVTRLRRTDSGVRITWKDAKNGKQTDTDAPCVVVTVPFSALDRIEADFSPATRAAMASVAYVPAGKVAFQATRRFWEQDDQIYGGISWTSRPSTQVWYPSAGPQRDTGILVGAYIWSDDIGNAFAAKTPEQRLEDTLDDVTHLHPRTRALLQQGVSVAWKNIPYSNAGWAEWGSKSRATSFPMLLKGDGAYLFAGEHMSYITGWQEGAVRSAHHVMGDIATRLGP
jgi:monoamine oxidase